MLREAKTEARFQYRSKCKDKDIARGNMRYGQADMPQNRRVRATREAMIFAMLASPSLTQRLERLDREL